MLERVAWCDEAEAALSAACECNAGGVAADVRKGIAELWKLDNGQSWCVTRGEGTEIVLVAFAGKNLARWMRLFYRVASSRGYITARFHTTRPGVARLSPFPIAEVERVYRVRLTDG